MKQIKRYLFGALLVGGVLLALVTADAQEARPNSIEALTVLQQGSVLNVRLTFKEPLQGLPPAFSVAKPARIAFDFPNTTNGMGKSSQTYNEGDLKSANIVQAEDRTRVVLNLQKAMTYEATVEGNNLLLALVPSRVPEGIVPVEHFAKASPSQSLNSVRDIGFRRGKDGEARITVDLSDSNAGIDIRQQGANLVVDFARVSVPEALRKRLDVTDFATPVPVSYTHLDVYKRQAQDARNEFLRKEIAVLDKQIDQIKRLKEQSHALMERKRIIESLQRDRAEAVRLLSELAKQMPEGVYLSLIHI